ncbi:MAG: aldehyde dehydrogenase family protein [Chitinophagaceae bacterium]|nr:aldehyde dehydrogenase family protein [Chitinophagaceae bacterium]
MNTGTQKEQLTSLRQYFDSSITRPYAFRLQQLKQLKRSILAHEQHINDALQADLKKSPEETWVTETGLLLQEISHTIKHLKQWMQPERVSTNLLNLPSSSHLYPSPLGVVLVIGPWNFPLQLLLIPVIGAIAAGNCVVMKPSEFAPATASLIEKIIAESYPPGLAMVVQGDGASVIPAMMNDFRFDHIFYTGSIPVGKAISQLAAKDLVPVTLELGGKDPCIVEKDADMKVAARRITVAKFSNAGQMCVAPDYLIVHEDVKDKLLSLMKEAIVQFYGKEPATTDGYCKIINEKRFDKLVSYLSQGNIVYGGEHDRSSLFIDPTVLDNVSLDAPVMNEEIFGPVLPVFTFRVQEEALGIIKRHPNPLSFYIFTSSRKREREWIEKVQFGNGCVNNAAWQFTNHHLPFGGIGQSGSGSYHGKKSFDVFTHKKAVMRTPAWFDPDLKYPPMKGKLKLLKFFLK